MYIIEKIIRLYLKLTKKEKSIPVPSNIDEQELEDVLTCNHIFMPLDSTKKIFACTKCGYIVTKKRLEKEKIRHKNRELM